MQINARGRFLVWRRLMIQVNADKLPRRDHGVQRFFRRCVQQVEPILQPIDSKRGRHAHRRASRPAITVERLGLRTQCQARHH